MTVRALSVAAFAALLLTSTTHGSTGVTSNEPVLLPVTNDPVVCYRLWFKVGSQDDPAGKAGLANITAQMLSDASTKNNTYEQILDKLYPLAAGYDASVSVEMTVVSGRVHRDNVSKYEPMLLDAILRPAFSQADLDRIKSDVVSSLENSLRYSSDEELGKATLYGDIFAGTPYGHLIAGTVQSVKGITLEDVKGFYQKYFTRDNVVIGLAGGYDPGVIERLENGLQELPAGIPPRVGVSSPVPKTGLIVTIVEKDAPATAISMGFPIDLLRGSKDWYALAIANSWLGEHRNASSHLYQVIRESRGLNYGDYSYIENYPQGGRRSKPPQNVCRRKQIFEIWIRPVPAEAGLFALRAALREFHMLVDSGMTQEQFDLTRKFLRKYVLHYAPTTMERLGYALDDRFYGIEGGHLERFRRMMETLTLADVNAAMKKYWSSHEMHVAIVTKNAGAVRNALVNDTPSPITYPTPKSASVLEEDRLIMAYPAKARPDDVRIVPVKEMFEHEQ
jgi:zinc protease